MKKIRELLFNRWVLGAVVVLLLSLVVLLVGDKAVDADHVVHEGLAHLARSFLVVLGGSRKAPVQPRSPQGPNDSE